MRPDMVGCTVLASLRITLGSTDSGCTQLIHSIEVAMQKQTLFSTHTCRNKTVVISLAMFTKWSRLALAAITVLTVSGCSLVLPSPSRLAVCGIADTNALLLIADVETDKDAISVGKLESIVLPNGASCPRQWLPNLYSPSHSSKIGREYEWFVVGAEKSGLGGTVFRLNWRDAQIEEWFHLPKGDLVLDVNWTKGKKGQAIIIGGDPACGDLPLWDGIAEKCAYKKGELRLVDKDGHFTQILGPDPVGRCEASFNPFGTAVTFRESQQCFLNYYEQVDSRIVVTDLASKRPWVVSGKEYQYGPVWSPNGKWIAFIAQDTYENGADDQIQAVNVQNHQVRTLVRPHSSASLANSFAWSPDGQKLAWFRTTNRLVSGSPEVLEVFDMKDSQAVEIATLNAARDAWQGIDWSPDGHAITWEIMKSGGTREFGFRDLREGQTRTLAVEETYNKTWLRWSPDGSTLGLIRDTGSQDFLDLFAWSNFNITTTVELPSGVDWNDLYWISK